MQRHTRSRERGLTVVETVVSLGVLLVASVGVTRSVVGSMAMTRSNREVSLATQAARRAVEQLRDADFAEVFRLYNADPADDPGGAGSAPGAGFPAPGLDPVDGDLDGFAGEILFPSPSGQPGRLTEASSAEFQGLAPDLDLNGSAADADVTATALVLPVVVRVRWKSLSGDREVHFRTVLAEE